MHLRYEWRATYSDGTHLDELNVDGSPNKYTNIDRSRLTLFQLIDTTDDKPKVTLHLKPSMRLIHRKWQLIHLTPQGRRDETVWIIGWHENRQGINVQMLLFIFEDGGVEFMDRWDDKKALYAPVILLPEEQP